ncbi:hypothetical protein [Croceivirga thetidis]|uniref:DUF1735 domain-containing protein n=1 Tax=Croceivirga thetidis TaxID=2721623 RepID=A0ABX1GSX8_9FLAO|nr:hypothetical protein [Croceivirga thetidis]NKI31857.1 hypothetical protein [Croceivirga thetidis]
MKKQLLLAVLAISALLLNSCDYEEDLVIFDNESGQTYVKFAQSVIDLPVVFDSSAEIMIPVQVTTISSSDRTVNISVINSGAEGAATSDQFNVSNSVTIPANSYEGMLSFTGIDAGIEIGETKTVSLQIDGINGSSDANVESTPTVISMFQVCPVEEDFFIGDYELTTTAPGIFGTVIFPQGTVTISQGASSPDARVFTAQIYPDLGTFGDIDFNFTLVCGTVVVAGGQVTGVGCAGSSTTIGPSNATGSYTAGDDSTITIDLADDEGGASCGSQANAQFVLTRI